MAWRGASLHQKSPLVGAVLKSRTTAKASSRRQGRSPHRELDDEPSDEWCMISCPNHLIRYCNPLFGKNSVDATQDNRPVPRFKVAFQLLLLANLALNGNPEGGQ